MRHPEYDPSWPDSWKASYRFDLMEVFGKSEDPGYTRAYLHRRHRILAAVQEFVPPGSHILDVGAAQGNFTLTLAERGYQLTWNDLREELVGYVKLKHDRGSVGYAPGNCFELVFARPFDAVLITEIIEHVAHPDLFLERIARLVLPGGFVIMTTPNGSYFRNALPRFSDSEPDRNEAMQFKPDSDGHLFHLPPDELLGLARQAGLLVRRLQLFMNPLTRGALKTDRLLLLLPKQVADLTEWLTSRFGGMAVKRFNMHALAVFEVPRACDGADPA